MRRLATLLLAALPGLAFAGGGNLYRGKHNLSVTGTGSVRATSEVRACVFCHVAHSGKPGGDNRPSSGSAPQPYRSSTMASRPAAQAGGAGSRMCLSCHDGSVAIGGTVKGGEIRMSGTDPAGRMTAGRANLGFDLSGSHPVAFRPSHAGRTRDPHPSDEVKLDRQGMVQCTSCHDPHDEEIDRETGKFLVKDNRGSRICLSCHTLPLWQGTPHQASLKSPYPSGVAAPSRGYRTISDLGCANCHAMHGAAGASLVKGEKGAGDDKVCLGCHDGRGVAALDIASQVAKPFAHSAPPLGPSGHDAGEGPQNPVQRLPENRPAQPRHAACVDCHDPHAAFQRPVEVEAPRARSVLAGVWGIDRNGLKVDPVNYEYEVCFKCHADSANQPQARVGSSLTATAARRAVPDVNLRRVFDATAASFHPVEGPGKNASVPGLLPLPGSTRPLTAASMIYCSDCHASPDLGGGRTPRGPHGSSFEHILERSYVTTDPAPYSPGAYALCFKCHDPAVLLVQPAAAPAAALRRTAVPSLQATLAGQVRFAATTGGTTNFPSHWTHVVKASTPCSVCHNAHGVSALSGNPVNNAHLIDFDVSAVKPNAAGLRQYTSRGPGSGTCSLNCHGREHDNLGY